MQTTVLVLTAKNGRKHIRPKTYFESTRLWLYKYDVLKLHENDKKTYCWLLERLRFTFTANGKRQTQVENFSEWKISS